MLLARPISHTSNQYIDFVDFLYFTGFVYHLECCVIFSGVKLSMGPFVLLWGFKNPEQALGGRTQFLNFYLMSTQD